MHLYAFVQAAEIWVKTESRSRGYLHMSQHFGNRQREVKSNRTRGAGPLHSFLIALRSGGEILPESRSNRSFCRIPSLFFLRSAARSEQARFYPRWRRANAFILSYKGREREREKKKKKEKRKLARSGVAKLDCEGNTEIESSGFLSPTLVSNHNEQIQLLRGCTSGRCSAPLCSALLCALTCTDARGPVFTPAQLLPAGGVGFHQLQTRDITGRRLAPRVFVDAFFFVFCPD